MSQLIRLEAGQFAPTGDRFTLVADDEGAPEGDIIISLKRYLAEGEALSAGGRLVGVRVEPDELIEDLAYDLPTLPVVALNFTKFRDGRPYSSARLLRERYGFTAEVRAIGDVQREQAHMMVRCGFDSFVPADGSSTQDWAAASHRFRHVYQRAADGRDAAFDERAKSGVSHGL